jgi:hypothetical protein
VEAPKILRFKNLDEARPIYDNCKPKLVVNKIKQSHSTTVGKVSFVKNTNISINQLTTENSINEKTTANDATHNSTLDYGPLFENHRFLIKEDKKNRNFNLIGNWSSS